jgi:hypothetical protein
MRVVSQEDVNLVKELVFRVNLPIQKPDPSVFQAFAPDEPVAE